MSRLPIDQWGPLLRDDPALGSSGANINFAAVESGSGNKYLCVRTYEKGVEAETLACGTGAVASAVSAQIAGLITENQCEVHMPGGILSVGIEDDRVYLEGPAEIAYRGSFELYNL